MNNKTLLERVFRSQRIICAGLMATALTSLSGCASLNAPPAWHDQPVSLLQGDGDLVKIFHKQPGSEPMREQEVFDAVASDSASWYLVRQAQNIKTEKDSFLRKERMDSWYKQFRTEAAKLPRSDLVAFMIGVNVSGYDFHANQFAMCLEAQLSCDMRDMAVATARRRGEFASGLGDLHHLTRNLGRYELRVELPTDRTTFTKGAEGDRSLESFLVQTRRRPLAFGIARIKSVEFDPATGHHIIEATLEAVLLKAGEVQLGQTPDYYWTNATKLDLRL